MICFIVSHLEMRQGSFMYCEKSTFVYFVILPLNTTLWGHAIPPCKYVSYTPGGGFALCWLYIFFFLKKWDPCSHVNCIFLKWLRKGGDKNHPPHPASVLLPIAGWHEVSFLIQTSPCITTGSYVVSGDTLGHRGLSPTFSFLFSRSWG